MDLKLLFIVILSAFPALFDRALCEEKQIEHTCPGTETGFSFHGDPFSRLENYRARYENCTFVQGNLELVKLNDETIQDLSFLSQIREVTGYVLIVKVYASVIPLRNLRIIRGRSLLGHDFSHYSLFVTQNNKPQTDVGLRELEFTSLKEISKGRIMFHDNVHLCFVNTINWSDITRGTHEFEGPVASATTCPACDQSCAVEYNNNSRNIHCWGEGPDKCQKLTQEICVKQCLNRCYGLGMNDCCNSECAGGCTGPGTTDCMSCKNFWNDGNCVANCPLEKLYNPDTFQYEDNPDFKYTYGTVCVRNCPDFLLVNRGACVASCGSGFTSNKKRECVQCEGVCPKSCEGVSANSVPSYITGSSIHEYENCTIVNKNFIILGPSFTNASRRPSPSDPIEHTTGLLASQLSILKNIKQVGGYVTIQSLPREVKSIYFLEKLEVIHGRDLDTSNIGLQIHGNPGIESLNMNSLTSLKNGHIFIARNEKLCYAPTNWSKIINPNYKAVAMQNRNATECRLLGKMCDPQCGSGGCWGENDDQCLECSNQRLGKTCLQSCEHAENAYDAGNATCQLCHDQCQGGCTGPNDNNCFNCKFVKDGTHCRQECPSSEDGDRSKYADSVGICHRCHENCVGGCSGPRNLVGPDGCNRCHVGVLDENDNVTECLRKNEDCPVRYYRGYSSQHEEVVKGVCRLCHPECKECDGQGIGGCNTCAHYEEMKSGEAGKSKKPVCVKNCTEDYFPDNERSACLPCYSECNGCRGPTERDCIKCRFYKIPDDLDDENSEFACVPTCPDEAPHVLTKTDDNGVVTDAYCSPHSGIRKNPVPVIAGAVAGSLVLVLIVILGAIYFWRWRIKAENKRLKLTAKLTGMDESEPLTPTDAKPDMSTLRLVKESELRKGNIIGSGAFGTVYKGLWFPVGENVKIPVAIKVLQEGNAPNQNKELLAEARIMASVVHPCCVRVLAVCMTAQMMLITQLMPLGCLLDYIRKNRTKIGSKYLLNWCAQIAKGMNYLESQGIVHRDLAARNVLVNAPGQVKITDFGLAKLLDYNEDTFQATGGKMPIKWLALECIQNRVFTNKSDVWSFGVTLWEIFTFGERPYENVSAREISDLLEKGERLSQPSICTIDVYMIMIKCWMLDAYSRPSFKELAEEFSKMARDPGRYLVINGDMLLRLPSHTYDCGELVRNMSVVQDGPETIMDAEEYLQPQGLYISTNTTPIHLQNPKFTKAREANAPAYADERTVGAANYDIERDTTCPPGSRDKKYGGLEKKQREAAPVRDSVNMRYSSDPCRVLASTPGGIDEVDETLPDMPAPPTPMATNNNNPLPLATITPMMDKSHRLPVDEDDYLQPKSSNPAAYMDLLDENQDYLPPTITEKPPAPGMYLDMQPTVGPGAVQNPEYFESLPQPTKTPHAQVGTDHLKQEKQPLRFRSMSTESEGTNSEHDYYNEYDQLNRNKHKNKNANSLHLDPRIESAV